MRLGVLATLVCAAACPRGGPPTLGSVAEPAPALEREIVRWTNVERLAAGLGALRWSEVLARAARAHSEEMARLGYFGHDSPVPANRTLMQRVRRAGLRATTLYVGENIAKGSWDGSAARDIVHHWMQSAGHRANLLRPWFSFIGIGLAREGRYLVVTQVFSTAGS